MDERKAELRKGQILTLKDFKTGIGLKDWAWRRLRRRAEAEGHIFWYRVGRICLVDVSKFMTYLENQR